MKYNFFCRIMNLFAIGFLIYGFTYNCLFLYAGSFVLIFSEIIFWFFTCKEIREMSVKINKFRW